MNNVIKLYPWEYERGFDVGIRRFTANWGRADAAHYDRSKMEEDRKAQAAAALCEIAVARFLNQYAHLHVWHWTERDKYRDLADVGLDVEVRRIRTATGVPVRKTDHGKKIFAAKILDAEYRSIEVLGYIEAEKVMPHLIDKKKSWCYFPLDQLKLDK
jgi:hypothetical protein